MPKLAERGVIHILALLLLLAGIVGGLYLVQHPTIFKPKAAVEGTRIEVVDSSGNPISNTTSQNVKVKLTYVAPSPITASAKRVFVTSGLYPGNTMGGLTGADNKCQVSADAAHLGGSWKAWLSDNNVAVASRMSQSNTLAYKLVNETVIANNWNDLVDGTLQNPINKNEYGQPAGYTFAWTGSNPDGSKRMGETCDNWGIGVQQPNNQGAGGNTYSTTEWSYTAPHICTIPSSLYCFEQDPATSSPAFPTHFKASNDLAGLESAAEQEFSPPSQTINWTLTSGTGTKTVYAQFKVDGVWQTPLTPAPVELSIPTGVPTLTVNTSNFVQSNQFTISWSGITAPRDTNRIEIFENTRGRILDLILNMNGGSCTPTNFNGQPQASGTCTIPRNSGADFADGNYRVSLLTETNGNVLATADFTIIGATPLYVSYQASPPSTWDKIDPKSYNVTVTNRSTQTWNATGNDRVRLGIHFGTSNDGIGTNAGWVTDQRFNLPNNVAPGGSVTIPVTVVSPNTAGSYTLRHRMVKETVAWFSEMQKDSVTVSSQLALSASYDVDPPYAYRSGERKSYSVTVTNTGTQRWNVSDPNRVRLGIHFGTSNDGIGTNAGWVTDQRFNLPNDVAPGASVTIPVTITAPITSGGYTLRHRMVKETVRWFDQIHKIFATVLTP